MLQVVGWKQHQKMSFVKQQVNMEALLDELDYDSDEHTQIYGIHIDVVNAISSRFPLNLPHREHGWYLSNDD